MKDILGEIPYTFPTIYSDSVGHSQAGVLTGRVDTTIRLPTPGEAKIFHTEKRQPKKVSQSNNFKGVAQLINFP